MLSLKLLYNSPFSSLLTAWSRVRKKDPENCVTSALDDPELDSDPLRAEYVRSVPEAQLFKGVLLQGYLVPADVVEGMEDMDIRDDDVFVITYPKSGTTWTEEIVSLIYKGGDVSKVDKELLVYRVHHVEVGRPLGHLRFLRNLRSPRLLATHLPLPLLPRALREKPRCKIVYVMRNPKDTAVSYYHHHKMSTFLGNSTSSFDRFLQHFMAGHVVYGSWFDHVLPYWQFCKGHPNNVFFMTYEELKLDLRGMVLRLCDFLERPLSDEAVDAVVRHCTFESMKTNKMVNREQLPIADLFDMTKSKFMRKGIIGDWKNHFTPEQSSAFDDLCAARLADCDLPIVSEPQDAEALFEQFGRILYNHPEMQDSCSAPERTWSSDEDSDDPDPLVEFQPRFQSRRCFETFFQMYLQSDPVTLLS
ncbi:hypothetical protein JTE90_026169 [Oedothorax gibbosus]|uniref:Sulfotransferase domain-containing protein n=1 Tax=Oedothorax gibbosus TaxID=931172 RepID=A0AAV6UHG5_9ARAC|nr:hypothetical protein JTE90_026169 [Oedothorax gibbosus]